MASQFFDQSDEGIPFVDHFPKGFPHEFSENLCSFSLEYPISTADLPEKHATKPTPDLSGGQRHHSCELTWFPRKYPTASNRDFENHQTPQQHLPIPLSTRSILI